MPGKRRDLPRCTASIEGRNPLADGSRRVRHRAQHQRRLTKPGAEPACRQASGNRQIGAVGTRKRTKIGNRLLHHLRLHRQHDHRCGAALAGCLCHRSVKADIGMAGCPFQMVMHRLDNGEFRVQIAIGKPAMKHGAAHLAAANQSDQ